MHRWLFLPLFEPVRAAASEEVQDAAVNHIQNAYTDCFRIVPLNTTQVSADMLGILEGIEERSKSAIEFLECELSARGGTEPAHYMSFIRGERDTISQLGCEEGSNMVRAAYGGISKAYEAFAAIMRWLESVESFELCAELASMYKPTGPSRPNRVTSSAKPVIVDNFGGLTDEEKMCALNELSKFATGRIEELKQRYTVWVAREIQTDAEAFLREKVTIMAIYHEMARSLTSAVVPLAEFASVLQSCIQSIRSAVAMLEEAGSRRSGEFSPPGGALKVLDDCRKVMATARKAFNESQARFIDPFVTGSDLTCTHAAPFLGGLGSSEDISMADAYRQLDCAYRGCCNTTVQKIKDVLAGLPEFLSAVDKRAENIVGFLEDEQDARRVGSMHFTEFFCQERTDISNFCVYNNYQNDIAHHRITGTYEVFIGFFRWLMKVERFERRFGLSSKLGSARPEVVSIESFEETSNEERIDILLGLYNFVDCRVKSLAKRYATGARQKRDIRAEAVLRRQVKLLSAYFAAAKSLVYATVSIASYSSKLMQSALLMYQVSETVLGAFENRRERGDQFLSLYVAFWDQLDACLANITNAREFFRKDRIHFIDPFVAWVHDKKGDIRAMPLVCTQGSQESTIPANRKRKHVH
ncbi:hypothetical protein PAPHI01_1742 [Pancytospora philotis]|nr:hypothetical protein PAPHI01_1742 [Pancytospora philotis]